nr:FYDLN acid domain-containing protein [Kordiimonas gwangyangensis]
MAKPEWGTKRTCPKCGTRFYDLARTTLQPASIAVTSGRPSQS